MIDYTKFDRSIAMTAQALQEHVPGVLSLEDFAAYLDKLKAARAQLEMAAEEFHLACKLLEKRQMAIGDLLQRVVVTRKAQRAERARRPKFTKAEWSEGVSKIMTEARRREKQRVRVPAVYQRVPRNTVEAMQMARARGEAPQAGGELFGFGTRNPLDGTRLWDAS